MSSLRLRVRLRQQPSGHQPSNLFVRLSPETAARLHNIALSNANEEKDDPHTWYLHQGALSTSCSSGIEFLPLALELPTGDTVYVSYNGGDITAPSSQEWIEIPTSLIGDICDSVVVSPLPMVQNAATLSVEPITYEDWAILQSHALWLEDGGLLQQVCIVYPNQILELRVPDHKTVAVRVEAENFANRLSVWPDYDNWESVKCCLRLEKDTEFIVKSKEKAKPTMTQLKVFHARQDYSKHVLDFAQLLGAKLPDVPQGFAAVHPFTFSRIIEECQCEMKPTLFAVLRSATDTNISSGIVRLIMNEMVPESHIAINELLRQTLEENKDSFNVFIQIADHDEIRQACTKTWEKIESNDVRLFLSPVKTLHAVEPWLSPSIDIITAHEKVVDSDSSMLASGVQVPDSMEGLTICVGELLRLPWIQSERTRRFAKLYRLKTNVSSQLDGPSNIPHCISAKNVSKLLEHAVSDQVSECSDTLSSSASFIPESSVFPSSLTTLLTKATATSHFIITGQSGSGRTHTALVVATAAKLLYSKTSFYINCRVLKDTKTMRLRELLIEIKRIFDAAKSTPSTLILDELDSVAVNLSPDTTTPDESVHVHQIDPAAIDESKMISDFVRNLFATEAGNVSLIITCQDVEMLHKSLRSFRYFTKISLPLLDEQERVLVFWKMLYSGISMHLYNEPDRGVLDGLNIKQMTDGFTPRDLYKAVAQIQQELYSSEKSTTIAFAISSVLGKYVPSAKFKSVTVQEDATTDWNDIGGLFKAKKEFLSLLHKPVLYRRLYQRAKIRLPRGILLFGVPGCGKSYIVPPLAKECRLPLIRCRGPELLDKYIGASESKVRELFNRAASIAPCILFFDEFDSLAPRRGSDHTGVTDRIVNQLLTFLDGVEDVSTKGTVYVIAATSRPDRVDPALLRPGRLERHVYVGLPENDEEWNDILVKASAKYALDEEAKDLILSGRLYHDNVDRSSSLLTLSPADISAIFSIAHTLAFDEMLDSSPQTIPDKIVIHSTHLQAALLKTRPALSREELARFERLYFSFRKDTSKSGDGDAASGARMELDRGGHALKTLLR